MEPHTTCVKVGDTCITYPAAGYLTLDLFVPVIVFAKRVKMNSYILYDGYNVLVHTRPHEQVGAAEMCVPEV